MRPASYETEDLLQQYLLFHYGEPDEQLPWDFGPRNGLEFPARCIREGLDAAALPSTGRALDVGCAVGRASFELATVFPEVVGIDFSEAFISAARTLASEGSLPISIRETGTICRQVLARRPEGVTGSIRFEAGDAQDLRPDLGSFDFVLAANLLCRLGRPLAFLERLPGLLNPGGQLVITDWCDDYLACRLCDWYLRLFSRAHYKVYRERECLRLLKEMGYQQVDIECYRLSWLWGLMTARVTKHAA